MKMRILYVTVLVTGLLVAAVAQTDGIDENALFGGDTTASGPAASPAAAIPAGDLASDDALFNDASAVSTAQTSGTYEEKFIKTEAIRIGGSYTFTIGTGIGWYKDWANWDGSYFWTDPVTLKKDDPTDTTNAAGSKRQIDYTNPDKREDSSLNLSGNLYFSARPSADLRLFGKATFAFPFGVDAVSLAGYNSLITKLNKAGNSSTWNDGNSLTTTDASANLASAAADAGVTLPNIKIWEFYSDFAIKDAVYFRAGKQMVKWGVGYFFQPADIISLTAVDVNDPKADREGPLAIKANVPIGVNNLDFYLIAPGSSNLTSVLDLKPAARFQLVLGNWELGLGAAVNDALNKASVMADGSLQYDRDVQAQFIATASGAIGEFNVFGEGLVQRYQSGLYFNDTAYNYTGTFDIDNASLFINPTTHLPTTGTVAFDHTIVANRDAWNFSGTAGAMYTNDDAYLTVMAQYYYNSNGYDNIALVAKDVARYLTASNNPLDASYKGIKLSTADLMAIALGYTGKHYVGVNISETFAKNSDISASAFWMANFSDLSGFVKPAVSIKITDQITLGLNTTIYYGAENTQFRGIMQALVDNGFPAAGATLFEMPRFKLGMTLSLGSSAF